MPPLDLDPDEWLYRRIHPSLWSQRRLRPAASNFQLRASDSDGLSMYRATECTQRDVLDGHEGFGLVRFRASALVELGYEIHAAPDGLDRNGQRGQAHVVLLHREALPGSPEADALAKTLQRLSLDEVLKEPDQRNRLSP